MSLKTMLVLSSGNIHEGVREAHLYRLACGPVEPATLMFHRPGQPLPPDKRPCPVCVQRGTLTALKRASMTTGILPGLGATREREPMDEEAGGVRNADPQTSADAAQKVNVSDKEKQVRECLLRAWPRGLTVNEIVERTGLTAWTVSPRMAPLERKGMAFRRALPPRKEGDRARYEKKGTQALWWAHRPDPAR